MLIFLFAKNQVTAGDFAMLLSINISVVTSLWHMSDDMKMFSENWGSVEQAIKILDANIAVQDAKDAKNLVVSEGKIEIKNLLFHHSGETPLFNNLNLTIEPGQKVGFVGYSGSGKTTLVNLILRLFEINKGSILIDGQNIKDISQESLRSAISVIPQDTSLFNRTILDNIKYGNIHSDDEDVIEAAKKASAHSFISSLPKGYYSEVGERAINISSGQRQRILIARALLKDSKIIIMDEATSNLDSITENFIEKKLKTILENKTSIIIAHRISTLQNMDRVIVFDKGQIVEDGSPQELFDKNGLFRKLCENEHDGSIQTKKIE